jgi:hypothetical protein
MKRLSIQFCILIQLIMAVSGYCQTLEWVKMYGGDYIDYSHAIVVDAAGNSYTTGLFSTTVDFDPGPDVFEITKVGGWFDCFVSKLDVDGNLVWIKTFQGDGDPESFDLALDETGNVYVAGEFWGSVDFDPGPDSLIFYAEEPHAGFVVKLDSMGDLVWANRFGSGWLCSIRAIDLDTEGNVYMTGMFADSLDLDPGPDVYMLTDPGNHMDIFVCKLSDEGHFVWGKHLVGTDNEGFPKVKVNSHGDVYVSGNFTETIEFNSVALTAIGSGDSFVCKYTDDGEFIWAKQIGGEATELCRTLDSDSLGNVYLAGSFSGTSDFDPGSGVHNMTATEEFDIYILKLNSNGGFVWSKQITGGNHFNSAHSLQIAPSGNVIVAGHFDGTIDFDSGLADHSLSSDESIKTFVLGLGENGQFEWVFGTGGWDDLEGGNKIAVSGSGFVYVTGYFLGTADFDPGPDLYPLTAPWYEVYVQKIAPPVKYSGISTEVKTGNELYPNPTTGMMYLKSDQNFTEWSVIDCLGRNVSTPVITGNSIDLGHLPNGIYMVRYAAEQNAFVQKVHVYR